DGHLRSLPWTVDGKKPKTRDGYSVQMMIGITHQFAGILCRCIRGDGAANALVLVEGHFGVSTINGGRRLKYELLNLMLSRKLEQMDRRADIHVFVEQWLIQRRAYA